MELPLLLPILILPALYILFRLFLGVVARAPHDNPQLFLQIRRDLVAHPTAFGIRHFFRLSDGRLPDIEKLQRSKYFSSPLKFNESLVKPKYGLERSTSA